MSFALRRPWAPCDYSVLDGGAEITTGEAEFFAWIISLMLQPRERPSRHLSPTLRNVNHHVFQTQGYGCWQASCIPRRLCSTIDSNSRMAIPCLLDTSSRSAICDQESHVQAFRQSRLCAPSGIGRFLRKKCMTMYTDKQHCRSSQQGRQRLSSVQRASRLGIFHLASNRIKLMGPGRYRLRRLCNATLTALGFVQQRDFERAGDRCRQRLFARLAGVSNAY